MSPSHPLRTFAAHHSVRWMTDVQKGTNGQNLHSPAWRTIPPWPVLLVLAGLVFIVPLWSIAEVNIREWRIGDSPAAVVAAPYFWVLIYARLFGAAALALLLWFVRNPASIWITVTSVWLAGPPFQFFFIGIDIVASSGGQRSTPETWGPILLVLSFGPAAVTACLLGFKSVRRAYHL